MAITKKEMFTQIKENYTLTQEQIDFINHEIELLDRKNSGERKPTKTQVENIALKESIMQYLQGEQELVTLDTINENTFGENKLSNQKISALITQLAKENKVEKVNIKRKVYVKAI